MRYIVSNDRINQVGSLQRYFDDIDRRLSLLEGQKLPSLEPSVPNGIDEIVKRFGDPNGNDFEFDNIFMLQLGFAMPLSWSPNTKVSRFRCHKDLQKKFHSIFKTINPNLIVNFGGCYNYRTKRGNAGELSTHSWGIAIDLNVHLPMPDEVVNAFKSEGFEWGGDWSKPDSMHFQYATGY
uniref:Putative peptidase n=1 Tax=viral metagenome TaxID=1070528 RepID=A0A6M3IHG7_9ZZZZ